MKMLAGGLVFALSVGCAMAQAPAKRPMTFADLQAIKRVSDPQISPSGKWVLFSVTDVSLEKNTKVNHLWVVPLDGSAKERQVTFGDGESNGRFAPDGTRISLTAKDQIFEAVWNDAVGGVGKLQQVTNVAGGADGAIWSADSRRFLFVGSVYPECSDLGGWAAEDACDKAKDEAADKSPVKAMVFDHLLYRHWNAYTGAKRSHVLVVNTADGTGLRDLTPRSVVGDAETPTFSLGGPLGYAWAPDSKEVAYVTNLEVGLAKPGVYPQPGESTNNDVFTLRLDDAGAKAMKVSTSPGSDDGPQYSPDGKWLAWRSQKRNGFESDKFELAVMDRKRGAIRSLIPTWDGWVDEFVWSPQSKQIYFASGIAGEEPIFTTDVDGPTAGQVAGLAQFAEFGSLALTPNGEHLVATAMRVSDPAKIVSIETHVPSEALKFLTHDNEKLLSAVERAPLEAFTFTGAEGARVQGFMVKPPNFDPAKKYPVKFLMHGGPQTAWGDAWSYRWNWELMAASGYVVVGINRRGSTGYGQKFVDEVSGDWGGRAYVDLMKGLDYAEATFPFLDKTRECALGASYGGFMANWVLTHTDRFKCIVTHDGMYNPQSAFGTTEEMWFNEWEFRPLAPGKHPHISVKISLHDEPLAAGKGEVVEQEKPAHPWDFFDKSNEDDPFRKYSPMLHIKEARTPTLVIHSQRDYRLDVSEGFQLFTALQILGVPSKMLYFPDEGHWILKPQNSRLWYETVGDWCDRWTGMGKYAAVGPERNPMAKPAPVVVQDSGRGVR